MSVPEGSILVKAAEGWEIELDCGVSERIGEVTVAAGGRAGKAGLLRIVGEMDREGLVEFESILCAACVICVLGCAPRSATSGPAKVACEGPPPVVA